MKNAIKRTHATRWDTDPLALGALSAAGLGRADARKSCWSRSASGFWFAGEALHETLWGTVGGAWESGERAAEAALRRLGPLKTVARRRRAAAAQGRRQ